MPARYLQINDDIGVDGDGNLEPGVSINLNIPVPVMDTNGHVTILREGVSLDPIPGTRTFKIDDERHFIAAMDSGALHEIDPPRQKDLKKERTEVQDSKERAAHTPDPDAPEENQS
jgi:hypothetical protein